MNVHRRVFLLSSIVVGCEASQSIALPTVSSNAKPAIAPPPPAASYSDLRARISSTRAALSAELSHAIDESSRRLVIGRARKALQASIVDTLLPAWIGTDWAFHGTAERPGAPEGIACGYFVATILEHAGLRLESRRKFGQATALAIQKALVADPHAHHRIFSVPAETLERRLRDLGDGLYVIGLDVHVGFVVVKGDAVRMVHASYTDAHKVIDEPLISAKAIANSRTAGYFVTSLLADDALVLAWLGETTVAAPH